MGGEERINCLEKKFISLPQDVLCLKRRAWRRDFAVHWMIHEVFLNQSLRYQTFLFQSIKSFRSYWKNFVEKLDTDHQIIRWC